MYDETLLRKRIKTERELGGWTQAGLAEELTRHGVSASWATVAKIEGGSRQVHTTELVALADIFEVPLDTLLGRVPAEAGLSWLRRALHAVARNTERVSAELVEALESISASAHYADPDDELGMGEATLQLLLASQAQLLSARQMMRKAEAQ